MSLCIEVHTKHASLLLEYSNSSYPYTSIYNLYYDYFSDKQEERIGIGKPQQSWTILDESLRRTEENQ